MKTLKSWVREVNALATCVLLFYTIVCAIVVRKQEPIELFAGSHSSAFHVNNVFVYAMVMEMLARSHTAIYTSYTEHALIGKTPTLRLPMLLLSFPAVNAAVLVGVVGVTDIWGVFAVAGMTLLMLCCAWMLSISSVHSFAAGGIAVLSAALYLAVWLLGVSTSLNKSSFAVVCYIVSAAGLMIAYVIAVMVNGNRLRQEIFMACSTLGLYTLGFAMYASVINEKTIVAPWTAFAITVVLLLLFCMLAVWRLPASLQQLNADDTIKDKKPEGVHVPFIDENGEHSETSSQNTDDEELKPVIEDEAMIPMTRI